jgi:formylglycine-generating enzyme required for sulfatase activity
MTFASIVSAEISVDANVADPSVLGPLASFQECDACPEMIIMPSGSFMMGAIPGESRNPFDFYGENAGNRLRGPDEVNIIPNEHPRHRVEMDIAFAIARNEITHAEWMACVEGGGCSHVPDHRVLMPGGYRSLGPAHPTINVSYLDTLEYVSWLNKQVGAEVYRLPTEAEWEYAARAGTETPFAQGSELTADEANFSRGATENLLKAPRPDLIDRDMPVPVDELDAANGWGVRHMSGNVAELTLSCWSKEHLGLATDSTYLANAEAGKSCLRVSKGGDFGTSMDGVRVTTRNRPAEDRRRNYLGFRIVRELGIKRGE